MKEKAKDIIEILKQQYPDALCALQYEKDYELMIAQDTAELVKA